MIKLPNIRALFCPDPGNLIFDVDLDRADAQVVAWEADDAELKQMFREGVDIHSENARTIGFSRKMAKMFIHGTNYVGSAFTMAKTCGITVHESEVAQKRWFDAHPGIKEWHRRVEQQLQTDRRVWNAFGYSRIYWDRIETLLSEAVAWIPQSTVGIVINKGDDRIAENLFPDVYTTLQVHDSLVGQFSHSLYPYILQDLNSALRIEIPYDDPLIIPVGFKVSHRSWGECLAVDTATGLVNQEEAESKLRSLPDDTSRAMLWEQINYINKLAEKSNALPSNSLHLGA